MDACQMFLSRYDRVYALVTDRLLNGLSEDQLRCIPIKGLNSIAWLIWHTTRAEDLVVNRFVAHRPQVFHEHGWGERLKVHDTDLGIGMTGLEVADLSARIDLAELRIYRTTVETSTRSVIADLQATDLDEIVDAAYIRWLVEVDGVLRDAGRSVLDQWDSNTKGHYLAYMGLTHHWHHWGEALTIRSLLGIPGR